jgi:hypothetical protein
MLFFFYIFWGKEIALRKFWQAMILFRQAMILRRVLARPPGIARSCSHARLFHKSIRIQSDRIYYQCVK